LAQVALIDWDFSLYAPSKPSRVAMGKKKEDVEEVQKEEEPKDAEDEEDTPTIKILKGFDDKFCALEIELEKEIEKLRQKYDERQAPLIAERRKLLSDSAAEGAAERMEKGTPACEDFWLSALSNAAELEELLHDCDAPVLEYLDDIQSSKLDPENPKKCLRLEFTFKENPYFTNKVLFVEATYDVEGYKPYKEIECIEVKSSPIEWKAGCNITVEKKKPKEERGRKGNKKPAKAKLEPIPSLFRILFQNVKANDPLPEALACVYDDAEEEDDELTEWHLFNMGEVVRFIDQNFLPYAVRYYTGEACQDSDDDDEESEEEDDDEESSDEESEEPAAKPKKGGKKPAAKKSGIQGPHGSGDGIAAQASRNAPDLD